MVLDQTANFVRDNLDAAVDNSQTTFSVVDASLFPDVANGEYNVVIWDVDEFDRPDQDSGVEIVRVTAVDTTNNDLTVSRGQENTSASSHPSGAAIQLALTSKIVSDIDTEITKTIDITAGNALSGTASLGLGDSTELDVDTDGIQTDEIDLSIKPTWTEKHTFTGGIEFSTLYLINDPGNATFADVDITSGPAQGDEQSYSFDIDQSPILTVYSEADGSGGIQNKEVRVDGDIKTSGELTEGSAL